MRGLSGDLLFWIAIDTLFLSIVKNLNPSQITALTSIPLIICILLQVPLLKIIKKIGNTNSVRVGAFLLLMSSILITCGKSYILIVLGKICYEFAFTFQSMTNVIIKNNLEIQNRSNDFMKIKTKANTIYATATMIISFIASAMFNINNYLPMIACIFCCYICFIMSFYIIDFSKFNKIDNQKQEKEKKKIKYSKIIIIILISYGIFYAVVNSGQQNGKLFIQQELLEKFNVEVTALIIGAILCISRIVRVISNIVFYKLHLKYKNKMGVILSILLLNSILFIILGSFIQNSLIIKFIIMGLGYVIILFIRDPFKVYMQDLSLNNTEKEEQQTLLTIMDLSRKIVRAIISLSFSILLINNPMILVMGILMILAIIEFFISIKLYNLIFKLEREESK